jgi:dTDP-L-rhamnose 4-epimerase
MMGKILVTGGAGFIGSHLTEELFHRGYQVRIFDNLSPQVHGAKAKLPECLKGKAEFIRGDIRNKKQVEEAISGADAVVHLAAETGVGQSMYQITRYTDVNVKGSAVLIDTIISSGKNVRKIILASSRSVYGEGKYQCQNCGVVYPEPRLDENLRSKQWEMHCPTCGDNIEPMPTDEDSLLKPKSVYAITKQAQEQMFLVMGRAYQIPVVVLRYFNVYGPRQSLNNPYTGILSIFSSRIINGKPPLIFEDGAESRDFVHVRDTVTATILALEKTEADNEILNVGSGERTTVLQIADLLVKKLGSSAKPVLVGKYRLGDIRHCYADLKKVNSKLGYQPRYSIEEGISNFATWAKKQKKVIDLSDKANKELTVRKLLRQM